MDASEWVSSEWYKSRLLQGRAFRALAAVWTASVGDLVESTDGAHYEYVGGRSILTVAPYPEPLLHEWGHYLVADHSLRQQTNYGHSDRSAVGLWSMSMEYAALLVGAKLAQDASNFYFWLSSTAGRVSPPFRTALQYDTDDPLARVLGAARACEVWGRSDNQQLIQDLVHAMREVVPPL